MRKRPNRFTIDFRIPAYWTPEQALAVFELVNDLSDTIWDHYGSRIHDLLPAHYGRRSRTRQAINPEDIPF
jgi:hypothetical protein